MSKSGRRKGQDFEQEVARAIRARLGVDAHRGAQTRKGTDAPDVVGMPEPWWAECKYGDRATIGFILEDGWTQANRPHTKPVVFFRRQRQPLRAVVLAEDLLELLADNARLRAELERALPFRSPGAQA